MRNMEYFKEKNMKDNKIKLLTYLPICIVINIVGAFIAVQFKLPIYLDTIGTFMASFLFGPLYGAIAGGLTSLINGISFDPASLYFTPVQIIVGFSAGMLYKHGMFNGVKKIPATIIVTVLGSIVSSAIAAFVFNGVTSSGSAYIVAVLKNMGVDVFKAVFSTQIFTDIIDKAVAVFVVSVVLKSLPESLKPKINKKYNVMRG